MFGHSYFGRSYFGPTYFGPDEIIVIVLDISGSIVVRVARTLIMVPYS